MDTLNIFYNNVVPEAMTGRINCLFYYNIAFATKIIDSNIEYQATIENDNLLIPTLMIRDKKLFDCLLTEYVDLAMEFYDDTIFDDEFDYQDNERDKKICKIKTILALLFANATVENFNNPCEFLRKRINFIKNDISDNYSLGYCDILKGNVFIGIEKDIINNETPYQMVIKVLSEMGDEFVFPKIKLGISDGVVYIYAIQNKLNENNSFCKKINRILYKVGEGYNSDYEENIEDLRDVTASFLLALNMCISYLYHNGYTKIVVPSLLNPRWNAKAISNEIKIQIMGLSGEKVKELSNNQDYLQYNLTNKLIRTFLRLGCHYNNIDVLSFPYEIDSCLHMYINDNNIQCNNSLLYETYKLVENGINKNTHIK